MKSMKNESAPAATAAAPALSKTGTLAKRAMLVSLRISGWEATVKDRKVEKAVAKRHKVKEGVKAGKYKKFLIDVDAPEFAAIGQAEALARLEFYKWTLPWNDGGIRILDAGLWAQFSEVMRRHRRAYEEAVRAFLPLYPALKAEAKMDRKGLYEEKDYPKPEVLEKRYRFKVSVEPISAAEDFRVDLADSTVEEIRQQITEDTDERLTDAIRDIHARLFKPIQKMADTLAAPKKIFRDSLVGNVEELVRWLPKLNITGSKQVADMLENIKRDLIVHPERLRDSATLRKKTAEKAAAYAKDLAAFMSPE
jgi:hypothetical protein